MKFWTNRCSVQIPIAFYCSLEKKLKTTLVSVKIFIQRNAQNFGSCARFSEVQGGYTKMNLNQTLWSRKSKSFPFHTEQRFIYIFFFFTFGRIAHEGSNTQTREAVRRRALYCSDINAVFRFTALSITTVYVGHARSRFIRLFPFRFIMGSCCNYSTPQAKLIIDIT